MAAIGPTDWSRLLKPEERAKLQERLQAIRHEFNVIYGLAFTERRYGAIHASDGYPGNKGRLVSTLDYEGFHVDVQDHGPLSYWHVHETQPDGKKKTVGGGDAICYEVARIEAVEKLLELLNARAERAAETLTDVP